MKKRILIPTDFSDNAWSALQYAIDLFIDTECEFFILHSFDTSSYNIETLESPSLVGEKFNLLEKESKEGLDELLAKIKSTNKLPSHSFTMISKYNSVVDAIIELIEEKDIELVVMGSKGVTNNLDVIYGGNAARVMEKVRNCPVLVYPMGISKTYNKEIVFPTSFKTHYKERELRYLIEISKINKSPIRVLHVLEKDEELSEEQKNKRKLLSAILEGADFSFHEVHSHDLVDAVNVFVESRDSGMVAFINKKHSFYELQIIKPMVKQLGYHTKVPVLALHDLRN